MTTAVATKSEKPTKRRGKTDPVTQYALDVTEGRIVAGRAVRLACQRHLRDLKNQCTAAFPYYFDREAAQHVIDFFPEFLSLENGDPFVLPIWLQFCYGSIFGWKCWGGEARSVLDVSGSRSVKAARLPAEQADRGGLRRFQHGFLETSKGSGKSPSAAGIGLYGLAFDNEPYAQIYSTGFDTEQASIILNDAIRMGRESPDLSDIMLIDKYNIAHPNSGSFMRAMSSEHRSKSGPRPHYVLSDEIHEHRDGTVVTKTEAGFKNRRQPLGLKYTNSGSDKTSYCWQLHQKSLEVLESAVMQDACIDDQWFAYVCHLDPCDTCYQDGFRQPKDGCPDCDDWQNPDVWLKVAPALGVVIQPKYLQDAITSALTIPSDYNLKRRLNFCIWTETHNAWISSEKWATCRRPSVSSSNADLHTCAAGLDPSNIHDLTSFVVAIRHEDEPGAESAEVEIEGLDEMGQRTREMFSLNFHVELIPFFWLPKDTLQARESRERLPWSLWARTPSLEQPYIFTTPGPSIDHNAVYRFVIGDAWKRFRIQRLGMDVNSGRYLYDKFKDDGKLREVDSDGKGELASVGQGKKLSEAFKFIEILIAHRRLWHDGNPVLAMCFSNAEPHTDRTKALWIEKPNDHSKCIDGAVASAMAIRQLMALPGKRKKAIRMFFMGGRR